MSTVFVRPLPFTAASTSPNPVAGSVANLADDTPGLAWFGSTTSSFIIDLGPNPVSYNYVGLFGSNIRATDTVRIQTGTNENATNGLDSTGVAYTGFRDPDMTAKVIRKLSGTRTDRYIRISFTANGHPDGHVEFSRLVVGLAIEGEGIEIDAEHGFQTQSIITTGPGYRTLDEYPSFDYWKISTPWIDAADWRSKWAPLARYTANGGGVMFIADDSTPDTWQSDALYGHLEGTAVGKWESYNKVRFETKLVAYAR